MKENTKKPRRESTEAQSDAFLPLLLSAVCMGIAFFMLLVNKFVYNFGGEIISPIIAQVLILLIPLYLCLLLTDPQKKCAEQLKGLGISRLGADYIFFMIFSALLLISTSFLVNVIFWGVYPISEGFTLMGIFTAGVGEYTVAYPYLLAVYAIFPAIIEELLFRGMLYKLFSQIGENVAIVLSVSISALFSFSLVGLPAAILCSVTYCFVRKTTGSLQASMIVHFIFNLYGIFVQTNVAKYFISSSNTLLLIVVVLIVWLISSTLFFTESAKIYKVKAEKISSGEATSTREPFKMSAVLKKLKDIFSNRANIICASVLVAFYAAITVIGYLF